MKRSDLIEVIQDADAAMQRVIENWQSGDLAGAVRDLEMTRNGIVKEALDWWESDNDE